MSDPSASMRAEFDRRIRTLESRVDDDLQTLHLLDEQWETFRRAIRENVARFEEAGHTVGTDDPRVHHDLAALREVDAYIRKLAEEQNELRAEASRTIRADGEDAIARLRNEQGGLPWD
ncbi:hypothetical protein [Leifsonia shinshuensis]|uniref:Uncharacterized protein n=1 Tax=Leifsonia shinshuensis TaxID=150026 RepID=A0A7G6YAF3_9MICO|nr:hypothetical protein [Leifsonia shinshuensis]QNE35468.1 hypothetical protein F1C12_10250 [Leifsonia shinshuensis]